MNVKWSDGKECPLFISSCYNGAANEQHTLDSIIDGLQIPLDAHWIIGSDFNRHHSDWSARLAPSASPGQAANLHSFIGNRALTVLNDPEVATRRSPDGDLLTVLDLALCSPSLADLEMESTFNVDFDTGSESDHAVLTWIFPLHAIQVDPFASNRLPKTAMSKWQDAVSKHLSAIFAMPQETREDLDVKVQALHDTCIDAMHTVANMTPKRKTITPAPWWNEDCRAHIELIKSLRGPATKEAQKRTRLVFRQAKRATYNSLCEAATHENIWQMAKWGTGSQSLPIPPLKDGNCIADTAEARADTFHRVFFPPPPALPPIRDEGEPPEPFTHEPVTLPAHPHLRHRGPQG